MKKNGMICNYYVRNYGSVLQSYALYRYLNNNFGQTHMIKYQPMPNKIQNLNIKVRVGTKLLLQPSFYKRKLHKFTDKEMYQKYLDTKRMRGDVFDTFMENKIEFSDEYSSLDQLQNSINDYNCLVLGSDQLWGLSDLITDYHTLSFAPESIKKVSYATSFGVSKLSNFYKKIVRKFIPRFQHVSVREIAGKNIIKETTGINAEIVVDPVMLIDKSEWELLKEDSGVKEKYIFAFFLGSNTSHREFVKKVARKLNCKIATIQHLDEFVKKDEEFGDIKINVASPGVFLDLIDNAELVITDSFHATVFSIIFQKNFYTLYRYKSNDLLSKNSRIDSLLQNLHLNDRILTEEIFMEAELKLRKIEYGCINGYFSFMIERSKKYLSKAMAE